MKPRSLVKAWILLVLIGVAVPPVDADELAARHRLLVLTDVENEPDDTESLVRLMLYSNVIDVEGLVATTSVHMKSRLAPESIRRVVAAYGESRANLLRHAPGFPEASALQALVKSGQPGYGMAAVGEGRDSEGSEWIIRKLDQPDARPLWVTAWGGPNTLAQALFKLRATRPAAELQQLVARLRVYTISDQDDSGPWIRKNFPDLFYIVSPGGYGAATWTGMNQVVPDHDNSTISNRWIAENIQQGHGPLGAAYPDVAYGMEGDTPSWLALIPNGLSVPERPEWGGWGGRYERRVPALETMDVKGFNGGVPIEPETRPIWTNADDEVTPVEAGDFGRAMRPASKSVRDFRATIWRWRDDFQNDFAARLLWATRPEKAANHAPVPKLSHPAALTVKSGERVVLDAHESSDPDGDSLSFLWIDYPEAGTLRRAVALEGATNIWRVAFVAPAVEKPATVHVILRLTDKGTPAMTRYERVIVTILPP